MDLSQDLEALEYRDRLADVEAKEANLDAERAMLAQRKLYAFLLLGVCVMWLVFIGAVVWRSANAWNAFELSEKVLIALITTTTINVLGLFYIVARWLFPQPEKARDKTPAAKASATASRARKSTPKKSVEKESGGSS